MDGYSHQDKCPIDFSESRHLSFKEQVLAPSLKPIINSFPSVGIDPVHKGVSLFLSYTNTNKMNSLHHVKEHPEISNFLQIESHSSKSLKVRAI